MSQKIIDRATSVIAGKAKGGNHGCCVLALIDEDGYPTASTLSVSKAEGIREVTFCTGLDSNKAARIRASNRASVCFSSEEYNITLVGTIEVLTDSETKKEMWYDGCEEYFPGGTEDPNYCVLRFRTKRYSLFLDWEAEVVGML